MNIDYDEQRDDKNSNTNGNNMLVELSCDETWFDMQFIEENNALACSSNEGSIMKIQSHDDDDDDDRDNHCYYDSGNDEDNEINNNNNATSRLVNDLTNVDKFENGMMAGK